MLNLLIANSIAVFHGLVLIPLIVVAPLIFWFKEKRYRRLETLFLLASTATVLSITIFNYCLLSDWEYYFRAKIDPTTTYSTGFVVDYMDKFGIYWTDNLTIFVGGFFIIFGVVAISKKNLTTKSNTSQN